MNTKAIFYCGEGSNLILGIGRENKIFFLRTPAIVKFFHKIVRKMILWCKKNHHPPKWICITHIWSSTLFPIKIFNFPRSTNKIQFFDEFPRLEKNCGGGRMGGGGVGQVYI